MLILYKKHAICLKDYRIRSFLSIQYVHGDLCKHLGMDSSTDHPATNENLKFDGVGVVCFLQLSEGNVHKSLTKSMKFIK